MNNIGRENERETGIQSLLNQYLVSRKRLKSSIGETSLHLDEDSLAAFAEGNLSRRESVPVISHLVDCGFCRHKTAELVMLDLELSSTDEILVPTATNEPSTISRVLNGVLAKIFGTTEEAVFAHHDDEPEKAEEDKEKPKVD